MELKSNNRLRVAAAVSLLATIVGAGCDRKSVAGSSKQPPAKPPSYMVTAVDERPKEEKDPAKLLARALLYSDDAAVSKILKEHRDLVDKPIGDARPLWRACDKGSLELVRAVVENGADINYRIAEGYTVLWPAVRADSVDVVKYLLSKGADVHAKQGEEKSTVLWLAESKEMAVTLMDAGLDPKTPNATKDTAMHQACRHAHKEVVEAYLDRKFPIELRDGFGMTPLHSAASTCWADARPTVTLLLSRGADIHARGFQGHTLLHECALYNLRDMAELLIRYKADVDLKDDTGRTPRETAEWAGKQERRKLIELLINNGAKGTKDFTRPDRDE